MAFGDHTTDQGRVRGRNVNGTFTKVVSGHEECGVKAKLFQCVQQLTCVKVGSVIVSQGNHILLCAVIDIVVIRDTTEERSWIVQRCGSCRGSAGIASTESPLAIGIGAVVFASATVSLDTSVAISSGHNVYIQQQSSIDRHRSWHCQRQDHRSLARFLR